MYSMRHVGKWVYTAKAGNDCLQNWQTDTGKDGRIDIADCLASVVLHAHFDGGHTVRSWNRVYKVDVPSRQFSSIDCTGET